jgi:hypothetical protein
MAPNDVLNNIIAKIIAEQETIIGPVALEQATQIPGFSIDPHSREVKISGNGTEVVERLVEHYRTFFGQAAVEVCKDATRELVAQLPPQQIPQLLR